MKEENSESETDSSVEELAPNEEQFQVYFNKSDIDKIMKTQHKDPF